MVETVFVGVAPEIEVRDGMFYIVLESGASFAAPPHVFLKTIYRANTEIRIWARENGANCKEFIRGGKKRRH